MLAIAATLLTLQTASFDDAVQTRLNDISFTVRVATSNRSELRKINRDFAMGYEAETVQVQWKDPLNIKLTSSHQGQTAVYTINGNTKSWHVPRLGLRNSENVANAPGKRQTLLDFGIISKGMKDRFLDGAFVRTDRDGSLIFDLTYQFKGDKSRHRVWVDKSKGALTRRMWYNQKGELMATFTYENHAQSGGVWVPTRITVANAEGKQAGVSTISGIQVNRGIADSVFGD